MGAHHGDLVLRRIEIQLQLTALGRIGLITEQIVDCLLWAVRYEENPGVRAEACHTLKVLEVKTEEVADVIQDRYLVESNPVVREELASMLNMFDISATEDMDMVAQIKKEVKKLCTRNIIARQIDLNEQEDDRRQNLARMIYKSEKDMREHEKNALPVMERMRSMSRTSDHMTKVESRKATPELERETQFTPTADQELEAILAKEETKSGHASPAETKSTPGTKSRATSATSTVTSQADDDDEEEEEEEEEVLEETGAEEEDRVANGRKQFRKKERQTLGEPSTTSLGSQTPVRDTEDDTEGEVARVTDAERPSSTVKFASHLEVADIPSRSMSSLGPSRLSVMDDTGKPSRSSRATATTATEGMVFGRDAVVEREKINEEARNTFAVMDARYQDMVQDLIELDNAFELGLTDGDRKLFEKKISNVKIVKTPPSSATAKPEIVVTVEKDKSEKPATDIADGLITKQSEEGVQDTPVDDTKPFSQTDQAEIGNSDTVEELIAETSDKNEISKVQN